MKRGIIVTCLLLAFFGCEKVPSIPASETPLSQTQPFELLKPIEDSEIDLNLLDSLEFEWTAVDAIQSYKLLLSLNEDMATPRQIVSNDTSVVIAADALDSHLLKLGLAYGETAIIYVAVIDYKDESTMTPIVPVLMTRKQEVVIDNSERIADPIAVKVAIIVEDFEVPGTGGKRMHEVCALNAPGGYYQNGGGWYDPWVQMQEFERDLETASHGVVQYEVVEVREADRFFTYFKDAVKADGTKDYVTLDTLLYLFETRQVDNLTSYDYPAMMRHYGYDKMVDAGKLDEIWVYTFPAAGMYESQMIGNGAFWCNSPGLSVPHAPCNDLCIVMCCNYERTTDLALHAYCHRVESIMNEVFRGWNYSVRQSVDELTNWEKFSAHHNEYEKFKANHAHIGMCHWPPNSEADYDYGNAQFVYTYADTWYNYPDIKEDNTVARRINKNEWKHPGGDQWGYMMWYYDHIPHFKGICPRDNHLNNWWHYIVQYKDARKLEAQLKAEQQR